MEHPKLLKLGDRIKMIRTQKNLSQLQLARLCGFEKSNLSRLEAGKGNPTVLTLYKITEALNIRIDELFKGW